MAAAAGLPYLELGVTTFPEDLERAASMILERMSPRGES
jgi:hypothetical protein